MTWHSDLDPMLRHEEPLAGRTTFRIGGPAAIFIEPPDEASFAMAYSRAAQARAPIHILGGGSNVLVPDEGLEGVVISTRALNGSAAQVTGRCMRVRAGTSLAAAVRCAAELGLSGLEPLAGIPGTIGGAVVMNAGGLRGSIGEVVACVRCVDRDGNIFDRHSGDVRRQYRETDIADPVVGVDLALNRETPEAVAERTRNVLAGRHQAQPHSQPSAGCFFKNPERDSAGRLIESAGLKGRRHGGAMVSETHANFILNTGGATAGNVMSLAEIVRAAVCDKFGVCLENEVRCWPNGRV